MKIKRKLNAFGWGLYVDKQGNLHDSFPRPVAGDRPKVRKPKWHVKKMMRKRLLVLGN